MKQKLTIIIPCYNEEVHIEKVLTRINEIDLNYEKEIILIDDGSVDKTFEVLNRFILSHPSFPIIVIRHNENQGKGSCLKSALPEITGQLVVIQDADLEYDPKDYPKLIQPIEDGYADVVFGSRFRGSDPHRGPFLFHRLGNRFFTALINLLTRQNFTDIHTCYKLFKTDVLKKIKIKENRFGVDPEMVVKLSKKKNIRIYEVGISYHGRSYSEGKKISWSDAFRAFYCILKYTIKSE
ncbi:MAG: glycosyltransferase family 2 protein [Bacteroidota bacterium]